MTRTWYAPRKGGYAGLPTNQARPVTKPPGPPPTTPASTSRLLSYDDTPSALDRALGYARNYWQFGSEPETQRAFTLLIRYIEALEGYDAQDR